MFLIIRVKRFLRKNDWGLTEKSYLIVDEGLRKAGKSLRIQHLTDNFIDSKIYFESSHNIFPIQLADYAAFAINRSQWIMGKKEKKNLDVTLLEIFEDANFNAINLEKLFVNFKKFYPEGYDNAQSFNRLLKGLNPEPLNTQGHS